MKGSIRLLLLLALTPLLAEAASQLTITELMQMLGSVESASAKFVETRVESGTNRAPVSKIHRRLIG